MSDEARSRLRRAQDAERQGDFAAAVEELTTVAQLYRRRGIMARAKQMMRHALRLLPERTDVAEELSRMEANDVSIEPAAESALLPSQEVDLESIDVDLEEPLEERLEEPLEDYLEEPAVSLDSQKLEVVTGQRGPVLAESSLDVWCSFCCRPRRDVGPMAAGAAGAFICRPCLDQSLRFMPPAPSRAGDPDEGAEGGSGLETFVGHAAAREALVRHIREGRRLVLLLGPDGSGRSTFLRQLSSLGLGTYVSDFAGPIELGATRLFLDPGGALDPVHIERLEPLIAAASGVSVVLTLRGTSPRSSLQLRGESADIEVPSSAALVEATEGQLPLRLAERVQAVVKFEALTLGELVEVGRLLVARRGGELVLSDEALEALAEEALQSERGARELSALLERVPAGSWEGPARTRPVPRKPARRRRSSERS